MKKRSQEDIARDFLAWQCRIRQIAAREFGGRPSPGMRPSVYVRDELVLPAMTVLIVPKKHDEATRFFRFQVQKTPDPRARYEAVMKHLQGDYFHKPKTFLEEVTAQFPPGVELAARLAGAKPCLLAFTEYGHTWRFYAKPRLLAQDDPLRQHTLWHNRVFNPDVPGDAMVLAFKPKWKTANLVQAP